MWTIRTAQGGGTLHLQEAGFFLLRLFNGCRDEAKVHSEFRARWPELDEPDVPGFVETLRARGLLVDDPELAQLQDDLIAFGLRWRSRELDRRAQARAPEGRRLDQGLERSFQQALLLLHTGRYDGAAAGLGALSDGVPGDLRLAELAAVVRTFARRRLGEPADRDPSWEVFDAELRRFLDAGQCPACGEPLSLVPGEGRCDACFASFSTWILDHAERRRGQ